MKIYALLLIISFFYSCKSYAQSIEKKEANPILFGKIQNDKFEYLIDTLSFKKSISNNLFSEQSKSETYDKLEIRKSESLGAIKEDYYFIVLYHFGKKLKTARFLENRSGNLYLNEYITFNAIFNSCMGENEKCFPNITIKSDSTKVWICSDKVGVCSADINECKSIRSIIQD